MGLIEKVTMEQDERRDAPTRSGNGGTAFQGEGTDTAKTLRQMSSKNSRKLGWREAEGDSRGV